MNPMATDVGEIFFWVVFLLLLVPLGVAVVVAVIGRAKGHRNCPRCGSGATMLIGEWGDEQWRCCGCNHSWFCDHEGSPK